MTPARRNLTIALGSTLAALAFCFSLFALTPSFTKSLGATQGRGLGVTYTFTQNQCIGGNIQYRSCRWVGTVTDADGAVVAEQVVFRDNPPSDVQVGSTVEALWTSRDPHNAYDLDSSRAWLSTLGAGLVSAIGVVVFLITALIWWRRVAHGGLPAQASPPRKPRSGAGPHDGTGGAIDEDRDRHQAV